MVTNAIKKSQRKVEGATSIFVRTYSNTMMWLNDQRKVVYAQRDSLQTSNDVSETITDFRAEVGCKRIRACSSFRFERGDAVCEVAGERRRFGRS